MDVGVTEPAAFRLAGGLTPSEFEEAFNEGSLQFGRCNVRGGRSARDNGEYRYTIVSVELVPETTQISQKGLDIYGGLKMFSRTNGGILAMPMREVENDSVNGMTGLGPNAQRILLLVQGTAKTHGSDWE